MTRRGPLHFFVSVSIANPELKFLEDSSGEINNCHYNATKQSQQQNSQGHHRQFELEITVFVRGRQ